MRREIKKARQRTCKKCGSNNAKLIIAHILCNDCGYDEDLFEGGVVMKTPKFICINYIICKASGIECEHQEPHEKINENAVYCKYANKNVVLDSVRPEEHSYLTFNLKDF